jgi:hypothetical protein
VWDRIVAALDRHGVELLVEAQPWCWRALEAGARSASGFAINIGAGLHPDNRRGPGNLDVPMAALSEKFAQRRQADDPPSGYHLTELDRVARALFA